MKLRDDNYLKNNREKMMKNVCQIIYNHIISAEKYVKSPTVGALLFDERHYGRKEWIITSSSGFNSTMPLFVYKLDRIKQDLTAPAIDDIFLMMRKIFDKM